MDEAIKGIEFDYLGICHELTLFREILLIASDSL